ncbi:MAG TPA: lipid kinase YegS [Pirellulales bacterium]|nr:lipid kinase YegS [Pirellulales bacterium]
MADSSRSQPRTLHVIANGKIAGDPRLREAVRVVRERGHQVCVSVTWEAGDAASLVGAAAIASADGVVAAGGDGTINEVVSGLVGLSQSSSPPNRLPALGIVPMGTANDFARGCGVPTDDLTEALLNVAEGVATPIDAGRVNGRTFVNVATGGFGTQVTVETPPEVKRLLGRVAYLVSGVVSIGRLQARTIRVRAPDFEWQGATYVFAVGNGRQAGGGFQMCEHALLNDGLLDLMIVPDVPYDQALDLLRELLSPPPHTNYQSVIYRQVPWVEISSTAGLAMNLDGEPLQAENFHFEMAPQAISCYLPADAPLVRADQALSPRG